MSDDHNLDKLGRGADAIIALGEDVRDLTAEVRALSHKMTAAEAIEIERQRSFKVHDTDAKETKRAIRGYAVTFFVFFLGVQVAQLGWFYTITADIREYVSEVDGRDRASAAKGWTWGDAINARLDGHDTDWRAHRRRHGLDPGPRVKHKKYNMDVRPTGLTPDYETKE